MKKTIIAFFILLASIIPSRAENFYIENYDIAINVGVDNSYKINEKIDTYFTHSSHGIFRKIPLVNNVRQANGKTYRTNAKISNVFVSKQHSASYENGNYILKIGKPDTLIIGKQNYDISYKYSLKSPESELYFNIIGTGWDTEIKKAHFKIYMPKDFPYNKVGFSVGESGYIGYDEGLIYTIDQKTNTIEGYTTKALGPHEAITIRIELPDGYFDKKVNSLEIICILLITLFLSISITYWYTYGKDEKVIPVVSFYPPKDMNSAIVGLIYSESANTKQLVSLIIYLADKGYINIKDDGINIELEKLKDYDGESEEIRDLMNALFGKGDQITVAKLKVSRSFYRACQEIIRNLEKKKNFIYEKNSISLSVKIPVVLSNIGLIAVLFLILADFNFEPDIIMPLLMLSVFPIFNIFVLASNFKKDSSFGKKWFLIMFSSLHGGIPLLMMISISIESILNNLNLFIYCFVATIIGFICLIQLPKKNRQSLEYLGQILGFRKFIQVAQENEIRQLVKQNPKYCYNMLSYAYVLGVSSEWIKKFESIVGCPDWYQGEFNTLTFNSLTDCLNEISVPSDSNGGITHSSSGGGGGCSGGGSGGGGGGSW